MSIRINYSSLSHDKKSDQAISDKLLRKAKGFFGRGARRQLLALFDQQIRLLAAEVAHREADPLPIYQAGTRGVLDALDLYRVGENRQPFRSFALPIIRQGMLRAKQHRA